MKQVKIFKTALRAFFAVPCAFLLWVVYSIVGTIEALISGVLQIVWGIFLLGASLVTINGVLDINALIR